MLISMIATFCVCWMPLHSIHLIRDFVPNADLFEESPYFSLIFLITHIIAMSSTLTNPIIYALMSQSFRKYLSEEYSGIKNCVIRAKLASCPEQHTSKNRSQCISKTMNKPMRISRIKSAIELDNHIEELNSQPDFSEQIDTNRIFQRQCKPVFY